RVRGEPRRRVRGRVMSDVRLAPTIETDIRPRWPDVRLAVATTRVFLLRYASNPIMLIRAPLSPVLILIGFHLAYEVSRAETLRGGSAPGVPGLCVLRT